MRWGLACILALAWARASASEPGVGPGLEPPDRAACPAHGVALNDFAVAGGWRWVGTTEGQDSHVDALCGGGGGDVVLDFTAPVAGTYRFRTRSDHPDADPAIIVRATCAAGPELACDDDGAVEGGLDAAVELALAAGQSVVVFVDGYVDDEVGAWRGPVELDVEAPDAGAGPSLETCACDDGRTVVGCNPGSCADDGCAAACAPAGGHRTACAAEPACDVPVAGGTTGLGCLCSGVLVSNVCADVDCADPRAVERACAVTCAQSGLGPADAPSGCVENLFECPGADPVCPVQFVDPVAGQFSGSRWGACRGEAAGQCQGVLAEGAAFDLGPCGCMCGDLGAGCPDPALATVRYESHDPLACTDLDFQCPDGWHRFFRPLCGCGCEAPPESPLCPTEEAGVRYVSHDPAQCQDPGALNCGENELPWSDPQCGCGCYENIAQCPHGQVQTWDDPDVVSCFEYPLAGQSCPEGSVLYDHPNCGCGCSFAGFDDCPAGPGWHPLYATAAECRQHGVYCDAGQRPYYHPNCGCGCIDLGGR
jgi:hypothetical protein